MRRGHFDMEVVNVFHILALCTTARSGTCGLTLGLHVCLSIAEMEITNYLSIIFPKITLLCYPFLSYIL